MKTIRGVKWLVSISTKIFIPTTYIHNNTISLYVDSGPSGLSHAYANTNGGTGGIHVTPIPATGNIMTFDVSSLTISDGVWIVIYLSGSSTYNFTFI